MQLARSVLAAGLCLAATTAFGRDVGLTGAVIGGSRMCQSSGCTRTQENRDTSVFVVSAVGEVARVRLRGRVYSADVDRVTVRLSECSLKLRGYLGGTICERRR